MNAAFSDVGAVVIGRNEGERLVRCLRSLRGAAARVVYVDSGSTDGSREAALGLGAELVALDERRPFTAARGRNAGLDALVAGDGAGSLAYVQFVDGDCEIEDGWIAAARARLEADPGIAVACGRRRERFPHASVYNALCDMEWNTPVGRAQACGGDALMRLEALRAVGGFDPTLIAGEEPELCFRLRAQGWVVERLDAPMTRHDAAMTRFGQWWRRMLRSGWAYAEGFARHGASPERYNRRALRSVALWGGGVPAAIVLGALGGLLIHPAGWAIAAAGLAAYPAMAARVALGRRKRFGDPWPAALRYGAFTMLGKLAQLLGALRFLRNRGRAARIIEYKS